MVQIETNQGPVTGIQGDGLETYLGIPFAKPPLGDLRWQSPAPVEPWAALDATTHQNRCLQTPYADVLSGFEVPGEESEDCLYLNVYTPSHQGRRPVMVWIHGGAYMQGSANEYDGSRLAAENDVVVVCINYRLGIFGYFDLSRYGEAYAGSASLGFQDQQAALHWVQQNITAYGGDPDCVTIFGESAGGGSVLCQLCSPSAEGLFHRAAALSPGEVLGPPTDNVALLSAHYSVPEDQLLDHLMSLPGAELRDLQVNGVFMVGASVDGTIVSNASTPGVRSRGDAVPLIIGSCRDEGTLFTPIMAPEHAEMTAMMLAVAVGNGDATHYIERRDAIMVDAAPMAKVERTWTDLFRSAVLRCGQGATEAGAGGWVYNFNVPTDNPLGITHASDIPFVFNQLKPGGIGFHDTESADNQRIARLWSSALARFARTGDPNGSDLPEWPHYDRKSRACLVLDHTPHIETDPDGPAWRDAYKVED
jgi:para-nitrobenzyl esterase